MLDKANADTVLTVIAAIGWLAFTVTAVRTALRWMVGKAESDDKDLAAALNRDLLKEIAHQCKDLAEEIHAVQIKQATQETRLQGIEAELKRRS